MKTLSRVWRPRFDASMLRQSGIRLVSRPKQTSRRAVSLRLAARALIAPVAVVCLPAIVVFVLASHPSGPDLFDLIPLTSHSDRYLILEWANLRRAHNALIVGAIPSGTMIRALGYMMDGDRPVRDGERVRSFVLLPEAGDALHPADRFGDEMINVELQAGNEVSSSDAVSFGFGALCGLCRATLPVIRRSTSWRMPELSLPTKGVFQNTLGSTLRRSGTSSVVAR